MLLCVTPLFWFIYCFRDNRQVKMRKRKQILPFPGMSALPKYLHYRIFKFVSNCKGWIEGDEDLGGDLISNLFSPQQNKTEYCTRSAVENSTSWHSWVYSWRVIHSTGSLTEEDRPCRVCKAYQLNSKVLPHLRGKVLWSGPEVVFIKKFRKDISRTKPLCKSWSTTLHPLCQFY